MNKTSFYIAWRYFFAKGKASAVSLMTNLTVIAIALGTTAMILILSVFSGFVEASQDNYSDINPDIKISAYKGKILPGIDTLISILKKDPQVNNISKTIEDKVYLTYLDKQDIAYLKGVDKNFTKIYPLDSQVYYGAYLNFTEDQILVSDTLARRMMIGLDTYEPIKMFSPRPGKGLVNTENDMREKETYLAGVFYIPDEKYGRYVFTSLSTAQSFLGIPRDECYTVELDLKEGVNNNSFKAALKEKLGSRYVVETREDQDAAYLKMLNLENMVVYLILALVVFVLSFSLIGVLYVIILDKKQASRTLWSMGMTKQDIKSIFFYTGFIITSFATVLGIVIGAGIGLWQMYTGVFAPNGFPFPIHFTVFNFLLVICTVLGMGTLVSYIFSRNIVLNDL